MPAVYSASIIAAFIAGVAALFAPCCITVLFPSYFASVFKERYKVFLMTFIFFLGVLTVFLPLGLGASALASAFSRYHNVIFILGGIMLLLLGLSLFFGRSFQMPFAVKAPVASKYDAGSVYLLGVFSAFATSCCAPVLAGVLALSAASGTVFWGTIYTLAYVLGMVLPLFLIALFLDKINFTEKFKGWRRRLELNIGSFVWKVSITELISGSVFLLIGSYIIYLALNNRLTMNSDYQLTINIFLARITAWLGDLSFQLPNWIWALIVIVIVIVIAIFAFKQLKRKNHEQ